MQLALDGLEGVERVRVLLPAHELQVTYDPEKVRPEDIERAVRAAPAVGESGDYDLAPIDPSPSATASP